MFKVQSTEFIFDYCTLHFAFVMHSVPELGTLGFGLRTNHFLYHFPVPTVNYIYRVLPDYSMFVL